MQKLLKKIAEKMQKDPSLRVFTDMYHICLEVSKTDIPLAVEYLVKLSGELDKAIPSGKFDNEIKEMYKKLNFIKYYLNYTAQDKKKGIEYMFYSNKTKKVPPGAFMNIFDEKAVFEHKSKEVL